VQGFRRFDGASRTRTAELRMRSRARYARAMACTSASTGYKAGTSSRARPGTRVPELAPSNSRTPARMCPRVPASGRAFPSRLSLVMKGSPVRVRASAFSAFAGTSSALATLKGGFGYETGTSSDRFTFSEVVNSSRDPRRSMLCTASAREMTRVPRFLAGRASQVDRRLDGGFPSRPVWKSCDGASPASTKRPRGV
jgi:hypothetical protein